MAIILTINITSPTIPLMVMKISREVDFSLAKKTRVINRKRQGLKHNQKKILENNKLLVRFIKQICNTHDTPSLIQLVAKDINYLVLCSAIAEISQNREAKFYKRIKEQCHKQGIDVYTIQERLKPVALSLGLLSSKNTTAVTLA